MELAIIKKMVENQIPPGKLGINQVELVDPEALKAYKFICSFYAEHLAFPNVATVEKECEIKLGFIDASEPLEYYVAQLRKRNASNRVARFIQWAIRSLEKDDDPYKVFDIMRGVLKESDQSVTVKNWSGEERASRALILDDYNEIKKFGGKPMGIETPWPFINDSVGGIQPGAFVTLISHSAVGKTWIMIKMGAHAHKTGKRILFISPEMTQEIVRYRFAAAYLDLPYRPFKKGMLMQPEEQRLIDFVEQPFSPLFVIADAASVNSVEQIEYMAAEYRPDLIFVDSYYLLDLRGRYESTSQRREALTIALYNQAKRLKIPYVVSTHFSSSVKKKDKGEGEDVGYTKQAFRLADLALGLRRDEELERNKVMIIEILKQREGIKGEILINFDLDQMSFTQIKVEQQGGYGDNSGGGDPAAPTSGDSPNGPSEPDPFSDTEENLEF